MGATINRGSTVTILLRPLNGISVTDLGDPAVAIVQDMVFLNPTPTVDTANNCITVTLDEEDTLQLISGVDVSVQQIWKDSNDDVIRFPIHTIEVVDTLMAGFDDEVEPEPTPTPEVETDVTVQDPTPEDEDDSEEPLRPLIWDDPEELSDVEVDEDFGEYQLYDDGDES